MEVLEIEACAVEFAAAAGPTPIVDAATRAVRQARAVQLDEIRVVVDSGAYFTEGHRSPASWLCETSRESYWHCIATISLAKRIAEMPVVHASFGAGDLAETGLRLLSETWAPSVADEFARDETMLLGWATSLPSKDLGMLLDTWRMHVDPNREASTVQERFDQRSVHLSKLLDGVGRLDGTLDPEGYRLVKEAIRALSEPAEDETRTAAQRRHDALVQMATIALASFEPVPGKKRRKPTVIGTATVTDMTNATGGGAVDTGGERDIVGIATIRRMACDCEMHRYLADAAGHIIDYGRADHWLDGGETEPDNLVLLCWYHHHLLHEQHWSIQPLGAGHFTLKTPDGDERTMRPPLLGAAPPTSPPPEPRLPV